MQDIKQLKEEWNHQCFCTEDSLKHATNACKYEKEKTADWWLEKLSLAVEQEKEKINKVIEEYIDYKDGKKLISEKNVLLMVLKDRFNQQ